MKEACSSTILATVAERWRYGASLYCSCFLLCVFEVSHNKKVKKGKKESMKEKN